MIPSCLCWNLSASLSADRQAKDRQAADSKEQLQMRSMPLEFTGSTGGETRCLGTLSDRANPT